MTGVRTFRPALLAGVVLLMTASATAWARDTKVAVTDGKGDAADMFGMREAVLRPALSPDGKKVLYLSADRTTGTALMVARSDGSTAPTSVMVTNGAPMQMRWCEWSSDSRIVCAVDGSTMFQGKLTGFRRLLSVAPTGGEAKLLAQHGNTTNQTRISQNDGYVIDWNQGATGKVLIARDHIPETDIGTHLARTEDGLGVDLLDTTTLASSRVEQPVADAVSYLGDGRGVVRMMATRPMSSGGYLKKSTRYFYRTPGSRRWDIFSTVEDDAAGLRPISIDLASDTALCFDRRAGRDALYRVALDGTMKTDLVYADPHYDVDDVLRLGRQAKLIGATTAADKGNTVYFDPEYQKLAASLSRALPGLPQINFMSSSADESVVLLSAGSDTDPGHYYVFDKTTKHLNELALVRPSLEHVTLATMKPVSFAAADGTTIPAYLTLPPGSTGRNLPAIVMPHGGPASQDYWGFDWLVQFFAHQGFAVLQPEFRGSTGYGDAWMLGNGFKSWRTAIGDVTDAGRWLAAQGIADPARLAIVGWSYGGYAALQSNVLAPDLFKAVVAIAPVTDLLMLKGEAIGFTSAGLVSEYIGSGPLLSEGSPAQHADRFKAPVMLFHGTLDQNVGVGETRLMSDRLKAAGRQSTMVIYDGVDHQIPSGEFRADMLRRADTFLHRALDIKTQTAAVGG